MIPIQEPKLNKSPKGWSSFRLDALGMRRTEFTRQKWRKLVKSCPSVLYLESFVTRDPRGLIVVLKSALSGWVFSSATAFTCGFVFLLS